MLAVVDALAGQPHVVELCRRAQIAVGTWKAITVNDVLDADTDTGRNMRTSQVVAASRVQRSTRVIRRARHISVLLGIAVEVYRGRELGRDERMHLVTASPGHQQRGLPNVYAMTVCPPRQRARLSTPHPGAFAQVNHFGHLPPYGGLSPTPHLLELLPIAPADAVEDAEPPPAAQPRRRRRTGQALAHELLAHPGMILLHGTRPGTIAAMLAAQQGGGWHGLTLADHLLDAARRRGIPTWEAARNPWGLLKTLLADVDPIADVVLGTNAPPTPEKPCGQTACDSHGWINHAGSAAKCPHCPPSIRATPPELSGPADVDTPGEAPF